MAGRGAGFSADGEEPAPQSKEAEEQRAKYLDIIELLVAAGYFRARISTLSPFDRVIGGLAWCLTNSAVDVDVDVVFIENSSIGQKITLSEKIIRALPRLKCPYPLEPHQIQGLNFVSIFPVMQWLVKKVLETREEMSDYIRNFSESQFSKTRLTPQDEQFQTSVKASGAYLDDIRERYKPRRQFRSQPKVQSTRFMPTSVEASLPLVDNTLLEYGQRWSGLSTAAEGGKGKGKDKAAQDERAAAEAAEEKRRIDGLIEQMSRVDTKGFAEVGNVVDVDGISRFVREFDDAQSSQPEPDTSQQKMGGAQAHMREMGSLEKQIAQQERKLNEVRAAHDKLAEEVARYQAAITKTIKYNNRVIVETEKLYELETEENKPVLRILRALLTMTKTLARQEAEFKANCKKQQDDLKTRIQKLESQDNDDDDVDLQRIRQIDAQYEDDSAKLQKIRKLLSKKKREIVAVQRQLDEIPSRTELSQYQKRFLELYTQVASKLSETRQFYSLYNVLDATKLYLTKEVSLLNSIFDNFEKAKATKGNQEKFLDTLETMLKSVKELLGKVEAKRNDEKSNRDNASERFVQLVDKQRQYYKAVLEFQEECRKGELLQMKLSEVQAAEGGSAPATPLSN